MEQEYAPQVTVIVCCFNAGTFIGETLATLLAQSYSSLTLLVIDDGSTDDSLETVRRVADCDSRVRLMCNDRNRGTAYTRMRGLVAAETNLVMFFDADDLASQDLLARLVVKFQEDANIMGVSCYAHYFNKKNDLGTQRIGPISKEAFFDLYSRHKLVFMLVVTLFDRRDAFAVGGYRQDLMPNAEGIRYEDFSEDVDLWCRMADLGAKGRYFVTLPVPLYRYRKQTVSLSTRNIRLMQLKMRWIKDCLIRRRANEAERSLAEFIQSRSWVERVNDYREDSGAGFYKRAGFAYLNCNYFRLVVLLALAAMCSPKLIRQKLRTQTTRVGA